MNRKVMLILIWVFSLAWIASPGRAQSRRLAPDSDDAPSQYHPPSAAKSVEIGDFYLRKKDFPGALSRFQEAIKTDPYYAASYKGLGKVYEGIGLSQKALAAYHKYLDLLPSDKAAEQAKDVQRAIERLEKKAGERPTSAPKGASKDGGESGGR